MGEQDDFVRTLEKATLKIIEEMARNMELACLVIERDAKENCPVSEQGGHFRASITHDVTYNASQIIGSVFSNIDYAPYVEKGTGVYAKDGDGRKTPWVYVKGKHSGKVKGATKTYTWEKALQTMAILQKKGIDAHATRGQKPHPFLEPARDANKDKVTRILAGNRND